MPFVELMRRIRGTDHLAVVVLVVVPIASGVTTALIVDGATDSGKYGLWMGSAVTAAVVSIIYRIQRRG